MPELPEVETIRRTIGPLIVGRRIESVEVRCTRLRRPLTAGFAASLAGRTIRAARRRAKYLVFDLDAPSSWIVHLGMSGRLVCQARLEAYVPQAHDHVIVGLDDGAAVVFNDPRRFGLMALENPDASALFTNLGPEPLDEKAFDADYLARLRAQTRRTVKDVLMDQRVVAGLGNIYVNEILFACGVRPRRRLARLTSAECARMVDATRHVLREAIKHRGTTISDFLDGIGRRGGYQWRRRVYDRAGEPCPVCDTEIKSIVVGQRSSFYCPRCQR
jgi:formamidopyrimidine-DNA glycosylase